MNLQHNSLIKSKTKRVNSRERHQKEYTKNTKRLLTTYGSFRIRIQSCRLAEAEGYSDENKNKYDT